MGRGIAYQWPFFMLYDEDIFQIFDDDEEEYEWDADAWKMFKEEVVSAFDGAISHSKNCSTREAYYIGYTDKVNIGIDNSGGCPCIFVTPQEYEDENDDMAEYTPEEIDAEVRKAFNSLIKTYGPNFFSSATSAWTSVSLEKY